MEAEEQRRAMMNRSYKNDEHNEHKHQDSLQCVSSSV